MIYSFSYLSIHFKFPFYSQFIFITLRFCAINHGLVSIRMSLPLCPPINNMCLSLFQYLINRKYLLLGYLIFNVSHDNFYLVNIIKVFICCPAFKFTSQMSKLDLTPKVLPIIVFSIWSPSVKLLGLLSLP